MRSAKNAGCVMRSTPSHSPYSDTGLFEIYAGTDASDAAELMDVVVDQLHAAVGSIDEAEVRRAKAQMKAGLLMALKSSSTRAEQLARQMIAYGRPKFRSRRSSPRSTRSRSRALGPPAKPWSTAAGRHSPRSDRRTDLKAPP